ncbi:uncharacterized protein LOC119066304 [Bradysia coprophila]|uniref:uncharacterized protein LOC119066304 n=1 Tax=Bradysia coprophila TaxID=38358 RepID=UPI00187DCD0C|nr:uncharacterized protein LOC119066304 [Bradysia coprophila]
MITWLFVSGIQMILLINPTSGTIYQIQSTKAVYESLTDKVLVNATVSKLTGLTVYLNVFEEFAELLTDVSLMVDLNDRNTYDFDVVRRTINTCRLFSEPTYEPVVQFLYKLFLNSGNFPRECPIRKGLYYIKDMKADPKNLPQMMAGKKAILNIKHLATINEKMTLLVYYEVHFGVERLHERNGTTKPRKPNRNRNRNFD